MVPKRREGRVTQLVSLVGGVVKTPVPFVVLSAGDDDDDDDEDDDDGDDTVAASVEPPSVVAPLVGVTVVAATQVPFLASVLGATHQLRGQSQRRGCSDIDKRYILPV